MYLAHLIISLDNIYLIICYILLVISLIMKSNTGKTKKDKILCFVFYILYILI